MSQENPRLRVSGGAKSSKKSVAPLSGNRSSPLSRRTMAFIRKQVRLEVAKQLGGLQKVEKPEDWYTLEALQKSLRKTRAAIPRKDLELRMIEFYEMFLPSCCLLAEDPKLEVVDLRGDKDLDPQAVHWLSSLRGLEILNEAKALRRFASCMGSEAKAKFLARAAVGMIFGLSASTSERTVRELLSAAGMKAG